MILSTVRIFWEERDFVGVGTDRGQINFILFLQTQPGKFKVMSLVPYTPSEWCDIGARLWEMVCQCGETQVQMTFINGIQMSDETLTVAPSATGLCLFHGPVS
ncbi:hypothetical protein TcG_01929, partial [Trypanosoma cruzi]